MCIWVLSWRKKTQIPWPVWCSWMKGVVKHVLSDFVFFYEDNIHLLLKIQGIYKSDGVSVRNATCTSNSKPSKLGLKDKSVLLISRKSEGRRSCPWFRGSTVSTRTQISLFFLPCSTHCVGDISLCGHKMAAIALDIRFLCHSPKQEGKGYNGAKENLVFLY